MVPGMTERERLAADVRRLDWLAEARFGPRQPAAANAPRPPTAAPPLSSWRRALTAALLLGQRIHTLPARGSSTSTKPSPKPAQ